MEDLAVQLVGLVVLIILSAFFSSSETAITTVGRMKVRELLEKKVPGSKALGKLRENPSRLLATILVGNNIVNIWASVLAASLVIRFLEAQGIGGLGIAIGIATGIMTFFILIFGEITPKTVAIQNAERVALIAAPPIWILSIILNPIGQLLTFISRPLVFLLGGRKIPRKVPFITEEELRTLLRVGEKEGIIEEEEREMIYSIFEFGDIDVREVMTPRPDIHALEVNKSLDEAARMIMEKGHSRIPVYERNLDNIVGIVYAKDLLKVLRERKEGVGLRDYLRPAIFVPESKRIDDLLHQMQAAKTHIAIIVDEYGATAGLVTLEDIVEEIVGEIHDEFEKEERDVEFVGPSVALVDARLSISDVNDRVGVDFPKGDYDTVSGFVLDLLGKLPAVGDTVKYDNVEISVEKVHRRRIIRLKIRKLPLKPEGLEMVGG